MDQEENQVQNLVIWCNVISLFMLVFFGLIDFHQIQNSMILNN